MERRDMGFVAGLQVLVVLGVVKHLALSMAVIAMVTAIFVGCVKKDLSSGE
jgi:hypothetical protein